MEERAISSVGVNDLDLNSPESIRVNLEKFPGERITVSLIGGGELQGVVTKVGTTMLYIEGAHRA